MYDERFTYKGEEVAMYGEYCYKAALKPANVAKCLKNADSYALFILAMYMLDQGWDYSGNCRAKPYPQPEP